MGLREAVETDAGLIAGMADAPRDVMRNLIHDRTVRLIENNGQVEGYVSFDARENTVYVTQIEGDRDCYDELLAEPVRFAQSEGMSVEFLVSDAEADLCEAAVAAGFDVAGSGPPFDGETTTRYRIENP